MPENAKQNDSDLSVERARSDESDLALFLFCLPFV